MEATVPGMKLAQSSTGRPAEPDRARAVSRALRALTPSHRQVLNETILSKRTVNEAAEVLGIPVATVKSGVYHALRALQLALAEQDEPP
jgi:RNA polymerase sigma-70 factor (ECF subfamily)